VDGDEKEQGPMTSYSGERRWDAAHRKWRRHGWDTLSVHAVGIKSAMARSLRKRAEGGIKERREGVQYRDEGEDQEQTRGRENEKP